MRVTIEGLRRWILIAASLLLAVVAGFFFYGRNRFRHIEKDLPAKLGVDIQQTATGFSYTQTSQGHTLFTLKASKLVQLKAGHALLHDVDITLYGPPGSGRQDRIYGTDFDYNQSDGVAISQGDVQIELEGVSQRGAAAGRNRSDTIRVKTSGLMFVQKSGEASTANQVEFQLPRAAGSAVGADYNAKTGVVVLNSQVHITTSSNGKPTRVNAGHATLLRDSRQALLVDASIEYDTGSGRADAATVLFRKDGTAEKVDAHGHVRLRNDKGSDLSAETAHVLLNEKSQPLEATLGKGVQFASSRPNQTMAGSAQEGTLLFAALTNAPGSQTILRHAEFRRDVHFDEQVTGLAGDPHGRGEKQVQAQKLDVDFVPAGARHSVDAQKMVADGHPIVTLREIPARRPTFSRRISGDALTATLASGNRVRTLDGTGNTEVVEESGDGARNTTRGDMLHATFLQEPVAVQPQHSARSRRKKTMETTLDTAVQDGHVMLTETPAKKRGEITPPATLTGWAQHAEYRALDEVLRLTGHPHITDGEALQLAATEIEYHRDTQNAAAAGDVQATYTRASGEKPAAHLAPPSMGGSGPVHVIADRAALDHATNQSVFYGTPQKPARMWQGADSLLAPVIAIDRGNNVLKAWGDSPSAAPVVDANFTSGSRGSQHQEAAARVHSRTLVYSDHDRRADFHGDVSAEQGDEIIHADDAVLYLKPAEKPARPAAASQPRGDEKSGSGESQLDRIIATGHVVFTQPGRKGEGEKLVYTADQSTYVLTGTTAQPPRLWDRDRGTTTGTAVTFNSQTDKVEVSGGKSSVVTETRAPR